MRTKSKKSSLEDAYKRYEFSKFKKNKYAFLALVSTVYLALAAQGIFILCSDTLLRELGESSLKHEIEKYCVAQITISACMVILHLILIKISTRSAKLMQALSILRGILQIASIEFNIEIFIIPFAATQNSSIYVFSKATIIQLMLLTLGFALFEPTCEVKLSTVVISSLLLIVRITHSELICLIPSLIICLALLIFLYFNCKTDRETATEYYKQFRNGEIYQSFLDLLPEGVGILMEGTQLKYVNNSMLRILECSEDKIVSLMLGLENIDAKKKSKKEVTPTSASDKPKIQASASIGVSDEGEEPSDYKKSLILKHSLRPEDMKSSSMFERGKTLIPDGKNELSISKVEDLKTLSIQEAKEKDKFSRARSDRVPDLNDDRRLAHEDRAKSDQLDFLKRDGRVSPANKDRDDEKEAVFIEEANSPHSHQRLASTKAQKYRVFNFDRSKLDVEHDPASINSPGWVKNGFVRKRTILEEKDSSSEMSYVNHQGRSMVQRSETLSRNTPPKSPNNLDPNTPYKSSGVSPGISLDSNRPLRHSQTLQAPGESNHMAVNVSEIETKINQLMKNKAQKESAPSSILLKYAGHQNRQSSSKFEGFKNPKSIEKQNTEALKNSGDDKQNTNTTGKFRALKSYATTHENIRSAYDSIMNRLREDRPETELPQSINDNLDKRESIFSFFKRIFSRNRDENPRMSRNKLIERRGDESRLRLDEEDCCIVINSKHKVSETKERFLEIKLSPTFIDTKPCILVLVKDTTERDLINRLKETDNYKNTLMASVSHELRTPLNCIISMQEMLREYISEELIAAYLDPAINSSKILLSLVNDILDFAQIRAGKLRLRYEEFQLHTVLKEAISIFDIQSKTRDVEIKFDWDSRISPYFNSDPHRIRQIVINLLGNAMKFTYQGSITLKAIHKGPNRVCIMVRDTGIGIKKEDFGKMFASWGKIDSELNPHGVGLGLSISQTLARRLGPKDNRGIKVQSEYGKGSCFYFTIESFPKEKTMRKNKINEETETKQPEEEEKRDYSHHTDDESNESKLPADVLTEEDLEGASPKRNIENFNKRVETMNGLRNQSSLTKTTLWPSNYQTKITLESKNHLGVLAEPQSPQFSGAEADRFKEKSATLPVLSKTGVDTLLMNTGELQPIRLAIPDNKEKLLSSHLSLQLQQASKSSVEDQKSPQIRIQLSPSDSKSNVLLTPNQSGSQKISLNNVASTDHLNVVQGSIVCTPQGSGKLLTFGALEGKTCKCDDILVVDDNDFNLLALRQQLEALQYKVVIAHNGQIAIDMVLEKQKSGCCKVFGLVFMDCDMPVKNGFQAAKELKAMQKRKEIPYFPIIATTAYVNKREIDLCFESGMEAYLNKPVMKPQLEEILKKWFKR